MTPDRVHPSPEPLPESQSFIPKPSPAPGDYVIQVPKDQIFRLPPPQNAALFASYTRRTKPHRRRCRCLFIILAVLLTLAAAVAVLYLVFRPKTPSYSVESFEKISTGFEGVFRAYNPNKRIGFYYRGGGGVTVGYNGVGVCSGSWPVFYQGAGNVTVFQSKCVGSGDGLGDVAGGGGTLDVDFRVPVRVRVGAVTFWTMTVKVGCDVEVNGLRNDSKVLSQKCKVKFRPW